MGPNKIVDVAYETQSKDVAIVEPVSVNIFANSKKLRRLIVIWDRI